MNTAKSNEFRIMIKTFDFVDLLTTIVISIILVYAIINLFRTVRPICIKMSQTANLLSTLRISFELPETDWISVNLSLNEDISYNVLYSRELMHSLRI